MKLSLVLRPKKQIFSRIREVSLGEILHLFPGRVKTSFFCCCFKWQLFCNKKYISWKLWKEKLFYKCALVQGSPLAGKSFVCLYDQLWMTALHQSYPILPATPVRLRLLVPKWNSCKPMYIPQLPHELYCLYKVFSWKSDHTLICWTKRNPGLTVVKF